MKYLIKKTVTFSLLIVTGIVLTVGFLFGHPDGSLEELKEKYAQAPSAFMQLDGMNVHYRDEGYVLDSLPIILIHGTGASLHTFDEWAITLKNKKRVVRMDLPAFGLTGPFPDRNYSIDNYVQFLKEFLDARGISHCIMGGNSLGGLISWRFALKEPEMVRKLILIDAAGYPDKSTSVPIAFRLARVPLLNQMFTFITPRAVIESSVENVYADKGKISEALVDRYFELSLRTGNRQAFVDRMQVEYDTSFVPMIKKLHQRTLVLWGQEDRLITTASAYRFHDDLPNDTLVILQNSGHVPMEENPNESLKVILSFIGE